MKLATWATKYNLDVVISRRDDGFVHAHIPGTHILHETKLVSTFGRGLSEDAAREDLAASIAGRTLIQNTGTPNEKGFKVPKGLN